MILAIAHLDHSVIVQFSGIIWSWNLNVHWGRHYITMHFNFL